MSNSDPIKHNELIEDNVFRNATDSSISLNKNLTETVTVLQNLIAGFKEFASVSGQKINTRSPTTVKDVKDEQAAYDKLNATFKGYTVAQKELIVAQEKLKLQNAQFRKDAKDIAKDQLGLTSNYQKQSAELTKLKNSYKELALAGRQNGVVAKGLLQTITEQDQKLRALDLTTGQYYRNIGNYEGAFSKLGEGVKGLSAVGIALAEVFGLDASVIQDLTETHGILRHAMSGTRETMESLRVETEVESVATANAATEVEELTVTQKAYNFIVGESTGAIKAFRLAMVGLGIGAVVAALAYLYIAWQNDKKAQEEVREENEKIIKLNEELRKSYEAIDKSVTESAKRQLQSIKEVLEAQMNANGKTIAGAQHVSKVNALIIENDLKANKEKADEQMATIHAYEKLITNLKNNSQKAVKNYNDFNSVDYQDAGKANKKINSNNQNIEDAQTQINIAKSKLIELESIDDELKNKLTSNEINLNKEINDLIKARNEKRKKEEEDYLKWISDAWKKWYEEEYKMFDDEWKKLKELNKEKNNLAFENDIKLKQLRLKQFDDDKQSLYDREALEEAEYQKRLDDFISNASDELKKTQEFQLAKELLEKEHKQNLEDIDKKYLEEQKQKQKDKIDTEAKNAQVALDGVQAGLDKRNALQQAADQNAATMAQTQIQVQATLAAQGKKNMLDFQLKQQAKALDDELQLKKKAQKEQEAIQLASTFLEFFKVYAKDGAGAAGKALTQTFLGKGIAAGFEAVFAEEGGLLGEKSNAKTNLFGGKRHKSGKDILVLAEEQERILSVNDNKAFEFLGGIDLLKNPEKYMVKHVVNDNSAVIKSIESLESTIKKNPQLTISEDAKGRLMLSTTVNGNTEHKIKASTPIIQTYQRNNYKA